MSNFKKFLSEKLTTVINSLDVILKSEQYNEDMVFSEFIKLKNTLLLDLKKMYDDDNIKFDIKYELSKHNTSTITIKALNNFTYYLLQGYDYVVVLKMDISGDDLITNPNKVYNSILGDNFRKYEL